jgi:hypothetical protein
MKRGLLLAAFLVFSCPVLAADYYVSTGGSDSNSGSSGSPWRTIQKAADSAKAGDTVYVQQGTYDQRVSLANSGNSGNRIVFKSSPRRTATVDGGFDIRVDYVHVEGFKITASGDAVRVSGDYIELIDNYFYNVGKNAISGDGSNSQNVHIADNHIYHSQAGIWVQGDSWLVENNEIERLYNYGNDDCDNIRFFGDNHVFRNNFLHGTQPSEIGGAHVDCYQTWCKGTRNILFENERCFDFHQVLMTEACYGTDGDFTFKNCIFVHDLHYAGGGYGLFIKGISGVNAINNLFADLRYRAYYQTNAESGAKNAIVKNNIFYDCGNSYTGLDSSSVGDYNLVYDCSNPEGGPNDIRADPLFVDYDNRNFSLQPNSPACGAGEGGVDIGPIPCGAGQSCTDQGLYCCPSIYTCSQPKSGPGCGSGEVCCASQSACTGGSGLTGDLNSDAKVDIFDLVLVAQNFGMTSGFDSRADANEDGQVDIFDLVIVAQNFGRTS